MAGNGPSNLISSQKEKWISYAVEKSDDCVFKVDAIKLVKNKTIAEVEASKQQEGVRTLRSSRSVSYVTGFSINQVDNVITILTCAHGCDQSYDKSKKVTLSSLEKSFEFVVKCVHQKDEDGDIAQVNAVDCRKDLLLLTVKSTCKKVHFCLTMGNIPSKNDTLILLGWPPKRCQSVAFGKMMYYDREYKHLTQDNDKGYDMKLMESPEMACAQGFSGGPLIDGELKCAGVFHGTQRSCGYAINIEDVKSFLHSWTVKQQKEQEKKAQQEEKAAGKRKRT